MSQDPTTNAAPQGQSDAGKKDPILKQWQDWIKIGKREIEKMKPELDLADKLWKGKRYQSVNDRNEPITHEEDRNQSNQVRFNGLRLRICRVVDQLYAKNPKTTATVKKPIMRPVFDDKNQPVMDPETGQQAQEDVSEKRAEIVEAVLDEYIATSGFKYHAKAAVKEAFFRPAAWIFIENGLDEDEQEETIQIKWHRFRDIITDPKAEIIEGRLEKSRFAAIKCRFTKAQAKEKGIDWTAITTTDDNKENDHDEPDSEIRVAWFMWDKTRHLQGYLSESGQWPAEPKPWPWKIDGLNFVPLIFNSTPGEKWDLAPIVEAAPIQDEQNQLRDTFFRKIVNRRPVTFYDPAIIDPKKGQMIADRARDGWFPLEGLAGGREAMKVINDEDISPQDFQLYQENEGVLDSIVGSTPGDLSNFTKATATEVNDVSQRATSQTDSKRDVIDDFFKEVIRKVKQIMEQIIDEDRIVAVVGKDGSKYWAPYDGSVLKDCDIDIEVGSSTRQNQLAKLQTDINAIKVGQGVTPATPGGIDLPMLFVDWLKRSGWRNAEKYKVPLPPPQAAPPPPPPPPPHVSVAFKGEMLPPQDQAAILGGNLPVPPNPPTPIMPKPPAPGNMAGAGGGATTGMSPMNSIQTQMNPIK